MNSETGEMPGEPKPVVMTPVFTPTSGGGLRVHHMMFVIGACAVVCWLTVLAGWWFLMMVIAFLVALGVGLVAILLRRSISQKEALLWAMAVAAGRSLPLAEAALAFSDHFGSTFRWRVRLLATFLTEGVPLPEALNRVPGALSRESEVLVRAGYTTGTLARSLREAASLRTSRETAWGSTAARLYYLTGLLFAMQSFTAFILYFIIPKFEAIFKDFGVSLPPFTIFTIEVSHFVIQYFFLFGPLLLLAEVLIPLAVLIGLFNSYALWSGLSVLDSLFRRRHAALVLRALALAVEGQSPIESALRALSDTYPSEWVRNRLAGVDDDVRQGRDWIESLLGHGMIRPAEAAVLNAAQRVGNLDWALRELADSTDRRLGYRLQFWLQMLFPVLILGMGAMIFVFAVAYFSPLVRLIEALSG